MQIKKSQEPTYFITDSFFPLVLTNRRMGRATTLGDQRIDELTREVSSPYTKQLSHTEMRVQVFGFKSNPRPTPVDDTCDFDVMDESSHDVPILVTHTRVFARNCTHPDIRDRVLGKSTKPITAKVSCHVLYLSGLPRALSVVCPVIYLCGLPRDLSVSTYMRVHNFVGRPTPRQAAETEGVTVWELLPAVVMVNACSFDLSVSYASTVMHPQHPQGPPSTAPEPSHGVGDEKPTAVEFPAGSYTGIGDASWCTNAKDVRRVPSLDRLKQCLADVQLRLALAGNETIPASRTYTLSDLTSTSLAAELAPARSLIFMREREESVLCAAMITSHVSPETGQFIVTLQECQPSDCCLLINHRPDADVLFSLQDNLPQDKLPQNKLQQNKLQQDKRQQDKLQQDKVKEDGVLLDMRSGEFARSRTRALRSFRGEKTMRGDRTVRGDRTLRGNRSVRGDRSVRDDRSLRGDRTVRNASMRVGTKERKELKSEIEFSSLLERRRLKSNAIFVDDNIPVDKVDTSGKLVLYKEHTITVPHFFLSKRLCLPRAFGVHPSRVVRVMVS